MSDAHGLYDAMSDALSRRRIGNIESGKVILADAERNHSRFLLSLATRFDCGTALRVTLDGQR
jgi:hypothetical protein